MISHQGEVRCGEARAVFGDSNTDGYDPRSFLGDRYPADVRWTGLLAERYQVLEAGQNGRTIPRRAGELAAAEALLTRSKPLDALVVMLGSNDLLMDPRATAGDAAARMEDFLTALLPHPSLQTARLLLVSPPPMRRGAWVSEERLLEESARLGTCYGNLARRLGVAFADAADWDIPLTFDGVHFSEEGHQTFARQIMQELDHLFS